MKKKNLALCDLDSDYIMKFATYLMENTDLGVHIFTTPEGFFVDENDYDVTILGEEFKEIAGFRPKGNMGHIYFLCESSGYESEDYIYKYQSVDRILDEIDELKKTKVSAGASIKKSDEMSKLIGVYSPVNHELQLPFSMALGQVLRTKGKVLFIDLEEISIMPNLLGVDCERNLMDLLYEINTNQEINIENYVKGYMGFDYIAPFINPNDISEIDEDTWSRFFEMLTKSDYDIVVVLFGRMISGFAGLAEKLDRLYVLGKPGDYFKKGQEIFFDYLRRLSVESMVENVVLPMSAGNLTDGTYQLEELLQGNLGVFVKKLINANGKM